MKSKRLVGLLLLMIIFFCSCEKEVDVSLVKSNKNVVVEGYIENGVQPYVSLTYSMGFFDKIDLGSIEYVTDALVTVTDLNSNKTVILRKYEIDTLVGTQTFKFTLYAPEITDPIAMSFVGEVEHTYKLDIVSGGKTYVSYTKIPASPGLDSVRVEPVPGKELEFSTLRANYTDPDTFGNCVRVETLTKRYKKDGYPELFFTSFSPVYDDAIVNGTMIPLSLDLGHDKTRVYSQDEFVTMGFVRKGDTVTLKWSAIDKSVFNFYQSLSFSASSAGNPFSAPVKVQGNVSGALGVWAGLGSKTYTVIDSL